MWILFLSYRQQRGDFPGDAREASSNDAMFPHAGSLLVYLKALKLIRLENNTIPVFLAGMFPTSSIHPLSLPPSLSLSLPPSLYQLCWVQFELALFTSPLFTTLPC